MDALPLPRSFYERPTDEVARDLIGKGLWVEQRGERLLVKLVETEAYLSKGDPASHSHRGQTKRNAPMFGPAGTCYVYISYGIHRCMNVVTHGVGVGEAVLLRAAAPVHGHSIFRERRGKVAETQWLNGPGKLCAALGIDLVHNERRFDRSDFKLVDLGDRIGASDIGTSGRIGISQAEDLPLRYFLRNSPWLSRKEG